MANDGSSDLGVSERGDEAFVSTKPFPRAASSGLLKRLNRTRPAKLPLVVAKPPSAGASASRLPRKRPSAYLVSFVVCVLAPALATSLYFAFIASDQFAAEARFAVRAPPTESPSSSADKLKSAISAMASSNTSEQDASIVAAYVKSRAIIDDLSKSIDLREVFRRPEADFWARLKEGATVEELTDYWNNMVFASVDSLSGIVTVRVRAFRRDDALSLANAVIKASEALANEISIRARLKTMNQAEHEVRGAEDRVFSSLADLRNFRDQVGFVDPAVQAASTGALLTELMTQKIKIQNSYFVALRALSPQAPSVQSLKVRLDGLDREIDEQKAKLTGNSTGSIPIASLLPKFEQLELQNKLGEKLYTMAQDGLERARQRAEAQSLYVSVFVPPALPQQAQFPHRFGLSFGTALVLLVLWGIGAFTTAVIEDHRI
jgi:capsular polysaccharide transport system permease protein